MSVLTLSVAMYFLRLPILSFQPHKEREAENIKLVENRPSDWKSALFLDVHTNFLPDPGSMHRRLVRGQTTNY